MGVMVEMEDGDLLLVDQATAEVEAVAAVEVEAMVAVILAVFLVDTQDLRDFLDLDPQDLQDLQAHLDLAEAEAEDLLDPQDPQDPQAPLDLQAPPDLVEVVVDLLAQALLLMFLLGKSTPRRAPQRASTWPAPHLSTVSDDMMGAQPVVSSQSPEKKRCYFFNGFI